jgi:hypothetical protein
LVICWARTSKEHRTSQEATFGDIEFFVFVGLEIWSYLRK